MTGCWDEAGLAMPWYPPSVSFCEKSSYSIAKGRAEPMLATCRNHDLREDGPRILNREDGAAAGNSPLLSLPLELRMQIYRWVHLMSTIPQRELAGYPRPASREYVARPMVQDAENSEADANGRRRCMEARTKPLLSDRPLCGLSSSLLRSCRQVYHEARTLPFTDNEFLFTNWFASGLWTASATMKSGMRPWQGAAMRYARLEAMESDLTNHSALREWRALCKVWAAGMRGLRLVIMSNGTTSERAGAVGEDGNGDGNGNGNSNGSGPETREMLSTWVEEGGLWALRALERLEVELVMVGWSRERKLAWCGELGSMLEGRGLRVDVVCTEVASR